MNTIAPSAPTAPAVAPPPPQEAATEKAAKRTKVDYPGLFKDGQPVKFDKFPEDWNYAKHKAIPKSHFACASVPLIWEAEQLEEKAKKKRQEAEQIKQLGNVEDAAKAKKLLDHLNKIEELKKQLAANGADVDALMGAVSG